MISIVLAFIQVMFFVRECVRSGVAMSDMLSFSLMRQIAGGDVSPKNLWLAEQVLNTFAENRSWFLSFPVLLQTAVYTFLRIIVDHQGNFKNCKCKHRHDHRRVVVVVVVDAPGA